MTATCGAGYPHVTWAYTRYVPSCSVFTVPDPELYRYTEESESLDTLQNLYTGRTAPGSDVIQK